MTSSKELALVELVASLACGYLQSFSVAAAAIPLAPDMQTAQRMAEMAQRELQAHRRLRAHLDDLTDLSQAVMQRQRRVFEPFFEGATDHHWEHACVVFAFGWSIARDFLRLVAPNLPTATRQVVMEARGDDTMERFAMDQLRAHLDTDARREQVQAQSAELVGRALTGYQAVSDDTGAIGVLLGGNDRDAAQDQTRRLAIDVMTNHHRRLAELGLDEPE